MTINVNTSRNEYTATSGQTVFNFTFKIYTATDLNVYVTPAGQECNDVTDLTEDYTVTGVGLEDGGSITLNTGSGANDLVTIVSAIPTSRTTDYQSNGDFTPETVNNDIDRAISLIKQVESKANRSLLSSECLQGPKPLTLPNPESGEFIRWKADVSGLENVPVSAIADGVTDYAIAAAAASAAAALVSEGNAATSETNAAASAAAALVSETNAAASAASVDPTTFLKRNLLINANFRINQRGYISGTNTSSANEYTLDRWRVVTSGQSITFSALGTDNTITCPAGGLEQEVEALNVQGGTYVISWTGTATCTVNAVARTSGESFTLTANTNVTVKFSSGTVKEVQLEKGSVATDFEYRSIGEELALCQRYYEYFGKSNGMYLSTLSHRTTSLASSLIYFNEKRITPTVTINGTGFQILGISGESLSSMSAGEISVKTSEISWVDAGTPFIAREATILTTSDATSFIEIDAEL